MKTWKLMALAAAVIALGGWSAPALAAHYVEAEKVSPSLLSAPPAENTEAWKAEFDAVRKTQTAATPKDFADADSEIDLTPAMMTAVVNPQVDAKNSPRLFALLKNVMDDTRGIVSGMKAHWNTRRPYVVSKEVRPTVKPYSNPDNAPNGAYPSSHTAQSMVLAGVLGQLFPDKRDALRARVNTISWHRIVAGVHYPADLEGGEEAALLILGALWQNEAFRRDFAAAQQEVAAPAAKAP